MSADQLPTMRRSGITLATLAAVCSTIVALTHLGTAPKIAANRQAFLEQSLAPVIGDITYTGGLADSTMTVPAGSGLPGSRAATVYRVYDDGDPAAALFVITTPEGYSGPIRLLVGIAADGKLSGVRVLEHRETPGLGDLIEAGRSDWILQFRGRSIGDPPAPRWRIVSENGAFDQLTGASITSRAVIKAIRDTLVYFADNRDAIFAKTNAE